MNKVVSALVWTMSLFHSCISSAQPAKQPSAPAEYEVLRGGNGFGFVVRSAGTDYCISSINQFGGKPGTFTDSAQKPVPLMPGPTFRQDDVQAWMLDEKTGSRPFLAYNGNYTLLYGEQVQLIAPDKKIFLAEMQFRLLKFDSRSGERLLSLFSEKIALPRELAGTPVCKMDGSVVGVITDVIEEGHRAKMETLCLINPVERMNEERPHDAYVARSFKTLSVLGGPTYTGVKIVEAKPEGISIHHDKGAVVIEPWKLAGPDRRKLLTPTIWEAIERDLTEQDLQKLGTVRLAKLVLSEAALSILQMQEAIVFLTPQAGVSAPKGSEEVQALWGDLNKAMSQMVADCKSAVVAEEELASAPGPEKLRAVEKTEAAYRRLAATMENLSIAAADMRGDGTDPTRLSVTDLIEGSVEAVQLYAVSKRQPDLKAQLGDAKSRRE